MVAKVYLRGDVMRVRCVALRDGAMRVRARPCAACARLRRPTT